MDHTSDMEQLRQRRAQQQRDAARGCLLAGVLEGAALLAAVAWGIGTLLEVHWLHRTAAAGFIVFTLGALAVLLMLLILGNTPAQRRLRREFEERQKAGVPPEQSD